MIEVKLADGAVRNFEQTPTVMEVAKSLSSGLAKAAIAGIINGKMCDLSCSVPDGSTLRIITDKDKESLEVIRHSTAHLLAQAVKSLYPEVQVTIGPVIENGFYYDFSYNPGFSADDFSKIEKKMQELVSKNLPIERVEMLREDAIKHFESIGEKYKVEIISSIPQGETISIYKQGDFMDLCRGPHVPSTSKLKAFKLTKVAGAYWRGNSENEMLQRIYGTAWSTKDELHNYLKMLEEAERRDHRKLAKQLDLFHIQEEAPGMIFWHPKGWVIWQAVEQYMRSMFVKYGYREVKTPQIVDRVLWEKSGHWDKFREDMFALELDERHYAIKPMNCPCHVQIFKQGITSYRELPIRLAEFGSCHRNESSGALHGLMRTRNFTQDDAHIFCTKEQIQEEVIKFCDMLFEVYNKFGLSNIEVKLSTRPDKRLGDDTLWDLAEKQLADALDTKKINWEILPGEGAFYGPKIEFVVNDCIGRKWTTGSVQLDFSMPMRLGAEYIASDGSKQIPVMLHRAICGSLERFIGILIEHYEGKLPLWLAPVQIAILNISEKQIPYAVKVKELLQKSGFRVNLDISNEKIGYKIRENTLQKIPYLIVLGDKEVETSTLTIRRQNGEDMGNMRISEFEKFLCGEL